MPSGFVEMIVVVVVQNLKYIFIISTILKLANSQSALNTLFISFHFVYK